MKAPDKIYINKYMLRKGMLYPAQKPADVPEFEYVRKDALLEWATTKRNKLDVLSDNDGGQRNAFQQIIDKLNSM